MESLRESHATYSGFHGYAEPWIEKNRAMTEYLANRLGYWYFITAVEFMKAKTGVKSVLRLHIANKGYSCAYHKYDLKIMARSGSKTYLLNTESPDNRKWDGGEEYVENIILDFAAVPSGKYELSIGMYENDTPIKLALQQRLMNDDGSYTIDELEVE